jgi:hypothetical protein
MSRKTTSNPEPRPGIGSALYSEFKVYIDALVNCSKLLMMQYPRGLLSLMIISMLVSTILAFALRPKKYIAVNPIAPAMQLKANDASQLLKTASDLKTLWYLSSQLDSLMKKQHLTARDSIVVQQAFKAMEQLRLNTAIKSKLDEPSPPTHKL